MKSKTIEKIEQQEKINRIKQEQCCAFSDRLKNVSADITSVHREIGYLDCVVADAAKKGDLDADAGLIEENAIRVADKMNRVCGQLVFLRECKSNLFYNKLNTDILVDYPNGYCIVADKSGIYIKTSLATAGDFCVDAGTYGPNPVAPTRRYYESLYPWIRMALDQDTVGESSVYILHVTHGEDDINCTDNSYNVDCLIDVLKAACSIDGAFSIRMMMQEAMQQKHAAVDAGTYVAVRPYHLTQTLEDFQVEALEHFRAMGQRENTKA